MDPDEILIHREQMHRAAGVVDAARSLLAIAPPDALEQLVGRVVVRNLRGAIAKLDNWPTELATRRGDDRDRREDRQ
jgi:hypothetical protein